MRHSLPETLSKVFIKYSKGLINVSFFILFTNVCVDDSGHSLQKKKNKLITYKNKFKSLIKEHVLCLLS